MMWWYGFGWGWSLLMWGGMLVFWGLVAWAAYLLVKAFAGPGRGGQDEARRILDERLASGEIDIEEYRRLRDLIGSGRNDGRLGMGGR